MQVNPDFEDLLRCLNRAKVKYLVVGAYAVIFYTEPRYTKDADIWVAADTGNARCVYQALAEFGAPLTKVSPSDFANEEMIFQIGIIPNRIDIIMKIEGVRFGTAWANRKMTHYGKERINVLGIKELIKNKRTVARPQDLLDLEKLTKAQKKVVKRRPR